MLLLTYTLNLSYAIENFTYLETSSDLQNLSLIFNQDPVLPFMFIIALRRSSGYRLATPKLRKRGQGYVDFFCLISFQNPSFCFIIHSFKN